MILDSKGFLQATRVVYTYEDGSAIMKSRLMQVQFSTIHVNVPEIDVDGHSVQSISPVVMNLYIALPGVELKSPAKIPCALSPINSCILLAIIRT